MRWPTVIRSAILLPLLLAAASVASGGGMQAGSVPQALTFGDFNGDGVRDLAVANAFSDDVSIFAGNGGTSFTWKRNVTVGRLIGALNDLPRDLVAADVDADGYDDLVVVSSGWLLNAPSLTVILGVGDPGAAFRERATVDLAAGSAPVCLVAGDLTGDTIPDILVGNSSGDSVRLLTGDGTGLFVPSATITLGSSDPGVEALTLFDLDGDGDLDVLGVTKTRLFIILQEETGIALSPPRLLERISGASLRGLVAGDFDDDGTRDWAVADAAGKVHLYNNLKADEVFTGPLVTITDSTLANCSDIGAADWDGDGSLDLIVASLQYHALIVVDPRARVVTAGLPTGDEPRALVIADLDRNGLPDVMTANEGDELLSSNEDVSWVINANPPPPMLPPVSGEPFDLLARAGAALPTVRGLGAHESDRLWCADPRRNVVAEVRDDGRPREDRYDASTWGVAQASGIAVTDSEIGYVTDRLDTTIRRVDLDTGALLSSIPVSFSTGALGFAGIARDEGTSRLYLAAPAVSKVVVVESNGTVVTSFNTQVPPHDLALDRAAGHLLLTAPGTRTALAYTTAGVRVAAADVSLDAFGPLFARSGLAGIGWSADNSGEVLIATTDGAVARLARGSATVVEAGSVAPGARVRAMGACPLMDVDAAYILDDGAVPCVIVATPPTVPYVFDLRAAIVAPQRLEPGAVAYTSNPSTTFVIDRRRLLIARFVADSSTPTLVGFYDFEAMRPAGLRGGPVRGLAIHPVTGDFHANVDGQIVRLPLDAFGAESQPEIAGHFSLAGGPADIEFVGTTLRASLSDAPAIVDYYTNRRTWFDASQFEGDGLGAIALLPVSGQMLVGDPSSAALYRFPAPTQTTSVTGFMVR